jgi:hypothetical protein
MRGWGPARRGCALARHAPRLLRLRSARSPASARGPAAAARRRHSGTARARDSGRAATLTPQGRLCCRRCRRCRRCRHRRPPAPAPPPPAPRRLPPRPLSPRPLPPRLPPRATPLGAAAPLAAAAASRPPGASGPSAPAAARRNRRRPARAPPPWRAGGVGWGLRGRRWVRDSLGPQGTLALPKTPSCRPSPPRDAPQTRPAPCPAPPRPRPTHAPSLRAPHERLEPGGVEPHARRVDDGVHEKPPGAPQPRVEQREHVAGGGRVGEPQRRHAAGLNAERGSERGGRRPRQVAAADAEAARQHWAAAGPGRGGAGVASGRFRAASVRAAPGATGGACCRGQCQARWPVTPPPPPPACAPLRSTTVSGSAVTRNSRRFLSCQEVGGGAVGGRVCVGGTSTGGLPPARGPPGCPLLPQLMAGSRNGGGPVLMGKAQPPPARSPAETDSS